VVKTDGGVFVVYRQPISLDRLTVHDVRPDLEGTVGFHDVRPDLEGTVGFYDVRSYLEGI